MVVSSLVEPAGFLQARIEDALRTDAAERHLSWFDGWIAGLSTIELRAPFQYGRTAYFQVSIWKSWKHCSSSSSVLLVAKHMMLRIMR